MRVRYIVQYKKKKTRARIIRTTSIKMCWIFYPQFMCNKTNGSTAPYTNNAYSNVERTNFLLYARIDKISLMISHLSNESDGIVAQYLNSILNKTSTSIKTYTMLILSVCEHEHTL